MSIGMGSKRFARVSRRLGVFLFVALAWVRPAQAERSRYVLDPGASHMTIHVGRAGLFGFAGHEHEIRVGSLTGVIVADPEHLGDASVELTFDAASLRVTGQGEPAIDVPKVELAMLGPKCLDVTHFPAIRFVSKAIMVKRSTGVRHEMEVRGNLILHGVTRGLTIPIEVEIANDRLTSRGRMVLRQSDFGITPISVAGVVKVKNELVLEWLLIGRRAPP